MSGKFQQFSIQIVKLFTKIGSLKGLQGFLSRWYPERQNWDAPTVESLTHVVIGMCNIVNIAAIEDAVHYCEIVEAVHCCEVVQAKQLIADYTKQLDQFCSDIPVKAILGKELLALPDKFFLSETIQFLLDWNPSEHCLKDILFLLQKAFTDGMDKRVIFQTVYHDSDMNLFVTCYFPHHLVNVLVLEAKHNLRLLKPFSLIQLVVGFHTIYSKGKNCKVSKTHILEVNGT